MELLLNLLWLTLALPAIWLWRHEPSQARHSCAPGRLRVSLLLICVLTLLFPVVSATDDLHPMRVEMEEGNPLKRIVKQSNSNSSTSWLSNPGSFFARSNSLSQICPSGEISSLVSPRLFVFPELVVLSRPDSRPPPSRLLV
jgi:hypothetical protein